MDSGEDIPNDELERRVLNALIKPVVRLARVFQIPLKDLVKALETAYFQEMRSEGLTLKEISTHLDISQRTAGRLSKQLRERFLIPELQHNLPRRIEFLLGTRPMGEARIRQLTPSSSEEEIRGALQQLMREGRVQEIFGRTLKYRPARSVRRLPRDTWITRIGALNSFAENFTNATYGRFFHNEASAFARTITFVGKRGTYKKLTEFYETHLIDYLQKLSAEAEAEDPQTSDNDDPEQDHVQLSLCWAPYDYIDHTQHGDNE